jgi:hypothetical protein
MSFSPMEELVEHHHNKEWDYFKLITHMPFHNADVKTDTPAANVFHTNKEATTYVPLSAADGHTSLSPSMVIKQNSLPRIIYHDTVINDSNNPNISIHNHFKVLTESSTKQNYLLSDSITQMTKNIKFFQNIRVMSSLTTEKTFLPVKGSDLSLVPTVKLKSEVLTNDGPSTLLHTTLSKIYSESKSILLNEKSVHQKASTDEKHKNSIEQVPESGSYRQKIYNMSKVLPPINGSVIGHINPLNKIWHQWRPASQSERRIALSDDEFHYFKHYSEQQNITSTSNKNKTGDKKFHETWLPEHSVIPWILLKNRNEYHAQGSGFRNASQAILSYSRIENPEESPNAEQSADRLQADNVVRVEDSVERAQEPWNKINITPKPPDVRRWGEYQNSLFQLHRKYKSGRKTEQAEQEGNSLPTTSEGGGDLPAARRTQKNIKQQKEINPHDRHLPIKHVSAAHTYKSQEAEQFSRNMDKKLSRNHSTHHTIQQYDVNAIQHKQHKSSCSKSQNCTEMKVTVPVQGTVRRLMSVDSSKSTHYDDGTNLQVDNGLILWSFRNISTQLWNITTDKLPGYWSTTFSTILLLTVLTDVFSTATTATSSQFLQCNEITKTSGHRQIILKNAFLQVFTLLGWGLFGCPLLAALVLATECSYQPRVFLMLSTGLFVMALLELFLLWLPAKKRELKLQDYGNEKKLGHLSLLQW